MQNVLRVFGLLVLGVLMSMGSSYAAYDMQEYYPLIQGNSRTFFELDKQTVGGETTTSSWSYPQTVAGAEDVSGVSTIKLGQWLSSQDYWYYNIAWDSEGLKVHRYYDVWEGSIQENIFLTPGVEIPRTMEMNTPKSYSFALEIHKNNEVDAYVEGTSTYTLVAVETLTVEAGTFEECLKIHQEMTYTAYDKQGGSVQASGSVDSYLWLASGKGEIKKTGTETMNDPSTAMVGTLTQSSELRWATINGATIGSGPELWNGSELYYAGATFNGSTMYLNNVILGDQRYYGFAFKLNTQDLFYSYVPEGYGAVSIPGIDFSNAYIKINGGALYIYDIGVSGVKYWGQWDLVTSPSVGFSFADYGLMQ